MVFPTKDIDQGSGGDDQIYDTDQDTGEDQNIAKTTRKSETKTLAPGQGIICRGYSICPWTCATNRVGDMYRRTVLVFEQCMSTLFVKPAYEFILECTEFLHQSVFFCSILSSVDLETHIFDLI